MSGWNVEQRMVRRIAIFACLIFLAGCVITRPDQPALVTTIPVTPTHPILTETPSSSEPQQCGYTWANEELPEVSEKLNQAFEDAGFGDLQARASAYGENCMGANGQVVRFMAMQTDFYLTIPVEDVEDAQEMGGWIAKVFPVIERFPPGEVPGPNLGYIGIRFTGSAGEKNLWFRQQTARDLLQQGLSQRELFEALAVH
jgi:hypothetical protein